MPMLDEPNGRFGRWGQVASALATFAFLAFVIVFLLLDWLVGAPSWALLAACVPIAVFSIVWGFTVIDDDEEFEPESIAAAERPSEEFKITLAEPTGRFGRFGQVVVTVWSICVINFPTARRRAMAPIPASTNARGPNRRFANRARMREILHALVAATRSWSVWGSGMRGCNCGPAAIA